MKKYYILPLFMIIFITEHIAQKANDLKLAFIPTYENQPLLLEKGYSIDDRDSIRFDVLKFYITNISFLKNKEIIWKEENSYHLLDHSDGASLQLLLQKSNDLVFDQIQFSLGVDSATNMAGAMAGDLDPMKGMYWTWQSGYINFKLEGVSSICPTFKNEFQFHLGGYAHPKNAFQTITLDVQYTNVIKIQMDIGSFLEKVDLEKENMVMSPSPQVVKLAEKVAQIFSISNEQ